MTKPPINITTMLTDDRLEKATILFLAYRHYIKGVAFHYVPFHHLVDEVVQQVYVEFLAGADKWDYDGNIKVLLVTMTRNIARAVWKSECRHSTKQLAEIGEFILKTERRSNDADEIDGERYAEDLRLMKECLQKVPQKARKLISLHYLEGISISEIASTMRIKVFTVYQTIYRLKSKLRGCIKRALKEVE